MIQRSPSTAPSRSSESGSVIILVVMFAAVMLALVPSTLESSRQQLVISLETQSSFQSELAAHSGLDFALRQLKEDVSWEGTGGHVQTYTGYHGFEVTEGVSLNPAERCFDVEGRFRGAKTRLKFVVEVNTSSSPLEDQVIASFGESVRIHDVTINGNMLVADSDSGFYDYRPQADSWELGEWLAPEARSLGSFDFDDITVNNGQLFKIGTTDHNFTGTETVLSEPVYTPSYQLDEYMLDSPNRVLFEGITELRDTVIEETAVFVLDPGVTLTIEDSELRGGAVVYVDPSYDLTSGHENTVYMKGNVTIGGGSNGITTNLGLIAPASEITAPGCTQHPELNGLSYVNSLYEWHQGKVDGQLVIHNEIDGLGWSTLTYNQDVAENPPLGFGFFSPTFAGLKLRAVSEEFTISTP